MRMSRSAWILLGFGFVVGLATAWPESAEAQCAMCRRALSDGEAGPLIKALRSGILFLLAVPIATFGTIAWYAVRGQRNVEDTAHETQRGPVPGPALISISED